MLFKFQEAGMKTMAWILVGMSLVGLAACGSKSKGVGVNVSSQGVHVNLPGVNISTDANGNANVSVPGVHISTQGDQGSTSDEK